MILWYQTLINCFLTAKIANTPRLLQNKHIHNTKRSRAHDDQ